MDQTREQRKEEWEEEEEEEEGASGGAPISAQPLSSGPNQSPADGDEDGHTPYGIPVSDAGDGGNEVTVITNQEEFLTKIHPTFLDMVHPIESQLVDELRNTEAFSSEDEQSIAGEKTRRKRARKLWGMLHRIPEEDFAHCFVPKLKERYPHVMAGLTFQLAEVAEVNSCMRHAMRRRINLKRLVDILPSMKCCSVDEYRGLIASQYCEDKEWEEVFQILHAHSSNSDLCSAVEALLRRKKVKNPERYGETADGGFVCTCHATSSAPPPCSAASGSADEEAVLKSLQVTSRQVKSGHVRLRHVRSRHVRSRQVTSHQVTPCHATQRHVTSSQVISYRSLIKISKLDQKCLTCAVPQKMFNRVWLHRIKYNFLC